MYKLIATDMDGTFLDGYGNIPSRNLDSVKKAIQSGIEFAIVTGRPYSAVKYLLKANNLRCSVIGCNGAQVMGADGRLVKSHYINRESLLKIMKLAEDSDIYYQIYDDYHIYTKSIIQAIKMIRNFSGKSVKRHLSLKSILGGIKRIFFMEVRLKPDIFDYVYSNKRGFYKIQIASLKREELVSLREKLKEVDDIDVTSSNYFNLEIGPKGINKGTALKELAESLKIEREDVIAIGDNLNDLPMIEYAGCGVAMGNAEAEVKQKACFITKSNDDCGVAYAIEKLILNANIKG